MTEFHRTIIVGTDSLIEDATGAARSRNHLEIQRCETLLMRSVTVFICLIALVVASEAAAQNDRRGIPASIRDSSVVQIMSHYRRLGGPNGNSAWVRDIMRQIDGPQPQSKLDAIADSLVRNVLASGEVQWQGRTSSDLSLLLGAGSVTRAGVPYSGTLSRLMQLHRDASGATRIRALQGMLSVPGRQEVLAYLRAVAISSDSTAGVALAELLQDGAVSFLVTRTAEERAEVDVILRDLFENDLIKRFEDEIMLLAYATQKGWRR